MNTAQGISAILFIMCAMSCLQQLINNLVANTSFVDVLTGQDYKGSLIALKAAKIVLKSSFVFIVILLLLRFFRSIAQLLFGVVSQCTKRMFELVKSSVA